jgi:hypothetical protein
MKDGKRYLLYVDRSYGGNTLSLPKEIKLDREGRLGAYYTEILRSIRIETLICPENLPEPESEMLVQNTFAWGTFGGVWSKNDNKYICRTEEYDYQIIDFKCGARSVEAEAVFTVAGFAAGFYVHTYDEGRSKNYVFSIEPDKERLLLTTDKTFEFVNACTCKFKRNYKYILKLILLEGVCEVYVDGRLIMQYGIELLNRSDIGLFCDRGETVVEGLYIYELEHD